MTEWWSYRLADFLMFSPQAYWRLVARYNAAWWPAQLPAVAAGVALTWLLARGTPAAGRAALLLLALSWAWVGWAFHWQRYSEIFLAAGWAAAACAVQAVALLAAAALPLRPAAPTRLRAAGLGLVVLALVFPLLAPVTGRSWGEAEVVGLMPDPTAIATLGALLALNGLAGWTRALLSSLPVLALLLGLATRWLIA